LQKLPQYFKDFTALEYLDLESANFENRQNDPKSQPLPDWIVNMSALSFLNLRHCGLSALPSSMRHLTKLRVLHLGANRLSELPEWLGDLTSLENLDISANELFVIPECIGKLKNLHTLELGHSGKWEKETAFQCVNDLDKQINELAGLPAWISDFPRLTHLGLGNLALKSLPKSLLTLKLESLTLNNNAFNEIPAWLGSMTSLKKLDLSGNHSIKALPNALAGLVNMEELNISDMPLKRAPDFIRRFTRLKRLSVGAIYNFTLSEFWNAVSIPRWLGNFPILRRSILAKRYALFPKVLGACKSSKRWTYMEAA
jgi:Leucine-rich repeat (LRR) protein